MSDTLQPEVVQQMRELMLTEEEFALIRANIFLFEGFPLTSLSPEGRQLIAIEKKRHRAALISLVCVVLPSGRHRSAATLARGNPSHSSTVSTVSSRSNIS